MHNYRETNWNTVYANTSTYTVKYTTTDGYTITRTLNVQEESPPDLDAGDTSALDDFLGGFGDAKK